MKELIKLIQSKANKKDRFIISIDGPAASGKSTLAEDLKNQLDATLFHMDDYFLPMEMKTMKRLSVSGGNVHYERMQDEILEHLQSDSVKYQKYNCMTNLLEPTIQQQLNKFVIIEGVYSQQKKLKEYYDFCIFTEISKTEQLERLKTRNPNLLDKFVNEWLPLEENYFTKEDIKNNSDYTIAVKK